MKMLLLFPSFPSFTPTSELKKPGIRVAEPERKVRDPKPGNGGVRTLAPTPPTQTQGFSRHF